MRERFFLRLNISILIFAFCSLWSPYAQAQSIGAYSGIYFTTHKTGDNQQDLILGPIFGLRTDIVQIKSVQLSLDISHLNKTYKRRSGTGMESIYDRQDSIVREVHGITDYTRLYDVTSALCEAYFSSPENDTFGIAVGLKAGITYFVHQDNYTNPEFIDINDAQFIVSTGGGGRIFRNYIFGTSMQVFLSLDLYSLYVRMDLDDSIHPIPQKYPIITAQAKIGLAYKFR